MKTILVCWKIYNTIAKLFFKSLSTPPKLMSFILFRTGDNFPENCPLATILGQLLTAMPTTKKQLLPKNSSVATIDNCHSLLPIVTPIPQSQ